LHHLHPIYQEPEVIRKFYNDLLRKVFLSFPSNFVENEDDEFSYPEFYNKDWIAWVVRKEFDGRLNFHEISNLITRRYEIYGCPLHRTEDEFENSSEWEDYVMEMGKEAIVSFFSDLIDGRDLRHMEEACNKIRDFIKEHSQTLGIRPPEDFVDFITKINEEDSLGRQYNTPQAEDLDIDIYYFLSEKANFVELKCGVPIYNPKDEYPPSFKVYLSYRWPRYLSVVIIPKGLK